MVGSEPGQRHTVTIKRLQKPTARQQALSNLVSGELGRASEWVSAAEAVLGVKIVQQGRQRGFLEGNRRCTEGTRYEFKTTQL